MDILYKHLSLPSYWAKKLIVLILYYLHMQTRYIVARNFQELFYSPDGFCFHTVVVIGCLGALLWSLYGDAMIMQEMMDDLVADWKELKRELLQSNNRCKQQEELEDFDT